jgi:gas vesicle protein
MAVGALLGVLFAPDKGSKTRQQILDKGEGYADALKAKFDKAKNDLTKKYETRMEEAADVLSQGKSKFEDFKNENRNNKS